MKITTKELLLRGILREEIKEFNKAIASEEKLIELGHQMDFRHFGKTDPSKYLKIQGVINKLRKEKVPYLRKLIEIDKKIKKFLEEEIGNNSKPT